MKSELKQLVDRLVAGNELREREYLDLIKGRTPELDAYVFERARATRDKIFGPVVFLRGLIEFSNYCSCNCLYCGIRAGNARAVRFRLSPEEVLSACRRGHALGFRTFVLQSGEDLYFTDDMMVAMIAAIKQEFPDSALTLSVGEKSHATYKRYFDAGADRYLLRHETADCGHYSLLHPSSQSLANRLDCLRSLKKIGFQVGTGFMVGSPWQLPEYLAKDLRFIAECRPHMVGIGPFLPHRDTPFGHEPAGSLELTLFLLGVLRLMLPQALIPATTALGTLASEGRERGLLAGANVLMPNLSPTEAREKYTLYNNKLNTGLEAAEGVASLQQTLQRIGMTIAAGRGDSPLCSATQRNIHV